MSKRSQFAEMIAEAEAEIKKWQGRLDWLREGAQSKATAPKRTRKATKVAATPEGKT